MTSHRQLTTMNFVGPQCCEACREHSLECRLEQGCYNCTECARLEQPCYFNSILPNREVESSWSHSRGSGFQKPERTEYLLNEQPQVSVINLDEMQESTLPEEKLLGSVRSKSQNERTHDFIFETGLAPSENLGSAHPRGRDGHERHHRADSQPGHSVRQTRRKRTLEARTRAKVHKIRSMGACWRCRLHKIQVRAARELDSRNRVVR